MKRFLWLLLLAWPLAGFAQRYVPGVHVTVAPPPLRMEVAPHAPSPRHMWLPGYWAWRGGNHVWIGGHWALPPGPGYAWEPAAWINENGAWTFYEGHWRGQEQPDPETVYQGPPPSVQAEVSNVPPPAPIEEVRPAVPFSGAVWIPGFWRWTGATHVWVAGRWSAQPAGYAWENHRWVKARDGRWYMRHGHWHPRD
jgi:hypothetical protein